MKTKAYVIILIGLGLNWIGFSDPALWPWAWFNIAGGAFFGTGLAMLKE